MKELVERHIRKRTQGSSSSSNSAKGIVNDGDSNKQTPLHFAIDRGSAECASYLIERGADANAGDADGTTPLHMAVLNDDESMVRLLVAHGADPDKKDNDGESARDGKPDYFD
jgi:ankyrin repeat protein